MSDGYDTDKTAAYLACYDKHIGHLSERPMVLLELGVLRGGSLLLWRDRFPLGTIVGLDWHPVQVDDDTGRIHVYQGAQQDAALLDRISAERAPNGFDVVIDDASHIGRYTAASFWHLFDRHVKPGGNYVIEDWGTGYWSSWQDGRNFRGHFGPPKARPLDLLAERVGGLPAKVLRRGQSVLSSGTRSHNAGMVGVVKSLVDLVATIDIGRATPDLVRDVPKVESVTFYPSMVVVEKGL